MTTRESVSAVRKRQWIGIIHDMRQSGLTVREYCNTHNLSKNAYFYWLRKIRQDAVNELEPKLVEVPAVSLVNTSAEELPADCTSGQHQDTEITIDFKGSRISFSGVISKPFLSMICEVISNAE